MQSVDKNPEHCVHSGCNGISAVMYVATILAVVFLMTSVLPPLPPPPFNRRIGFDTNTKVAKYNASDFYLILVCSQKCIFNLVKFYQFDLCLAGFLCSFT